ncbi:hypothetical protein Fmac_002621 [Flemingia macrophylla]|uniref:Plant heme peroxidase family profile domain-containing protein n=1 Tax=Flemingia macrophylla TaxID=520843 RepID=A0ABD1NKI6_9FABA
MMELNPIDEEYTKEIEKARRELRALIYREKCAPDMLRLAWQDACSYNPESQIKGGPSGWIRNEDVLERQENKGLAKPVRLCEDVKAKLKKVSYADLYQLAGVVAVEVTGGPTIPFLPGREDADESPQEGRLPNPDKKGASHLRDIFSTRMGLSDKEIVALLGGHVLVRQTYVIDGDNKVNKEIGKREGNDSSETQNLREPSQVEKKEESVAPKDKEERDPWKFDNSYFEKSLAHATLNMDKALTEDKKFRKHVEHYAKNKEAFFEDYAVAHKKLSEVGCNLKHPFMFRNVPPEKLKQIKPKAKGVLRTVIIAVAVLGYLRKKKSSQVKT